MDDLRNRLGVCNHLLGNLIIEEPEGKQRGVWDSLLENSICLFYKSLLHHLYYQGPLEFVCVPKGHGTSLLIQHVQSLDEESQKRRFETLPEPIAKYLRDVVVMDKANKEIIAQCLHEVVSHTRSLLLDHEEGECKKSGRQQRLVMVFSQDMLHLFLEYIDLFYSLSGFKSFVFLTGSSATAARELLHTSIKQHSNGTKVFNRPVSVTEVSEYLIETKQTLFIDCLLALFRYNLRQYGHRLDSVLAKAQGIIILDTILAQQERRIPLFLPRAVASDLQTIALENVKAQLFFLYPEIFLSLFDIFESCIRNCKACNDLRSIASFFLALVRGTGASRDLFCFDSIKGFGIKNKFGRYTTLTKLRIKPRSRDELNFSVFVTMRKNLTL